MTDKTNIDADFSEAGVVIDPESVRRCGLRDLLFRYGWIMQGLATSAIMEEDEIKESAEFAARKTTEDMIWELFNKGE